MLCQITQLRVLGKRLDHVALRAAEPIEGELEVHDWVEGSNRRRAFRMASLQDGQRQLVSALADVTLVRMAKDHFILAGTQTATVDGELLEFAQAWFVRVLPPPAEAPPVVLGDGRVLNVAKVHITRPHEVPESDQRTRVVQPTSAKR